MSNTFLDTSHLEEYIRNINMNINILYFEENFKNLWTRINNVASKLEESIKEINKYSNPKNENDFSILMMNASILKDSITLLLKILKLEINKKTDFFIDHYFWDYNEYNKKINDETFFSFLRSIIFAHPTSTKFNKSRKKLMKENQIFLNKSIDFNVENTMWFSIKKEEEIKNLISLSINVLTFENKDIYNIQNKLVDEKTITLFFSLDWLKDYIKHYYSFLKEVNLKIKQDIKQIQNKWLEVKIDNKLSRIEQYRQIKKILKERYIDTYKIEKIINLLKTESTNNFNDTYINNYKQYLINFLPKIKKNINKKVYIDIDDILDPFFNLYFAIKVIPYKHVVYLIEKIYEYIYDERKTLKNVENIEDIYLKNKQPCSDEEWGLSCLKVLYLLSKKYLKTKIIMDFNKMKYNELILLIETIFYNEYVKNKGVENE